MERLHMVARRLGQIPLKRPACQVPLITLAGEIFVRRDGLSRQFLTEYLADKGYAVICAPVAEWVLYADYIINKGLGAERRKGFQNKIKARIKNHVMRSDERHIKTALSASGLIHAKPIDIASAIDTAKAHLSPHLSGEAILTVGNTMREVAAETCGAIAIGPFGCMPNRISEAILTETMSCRDKLAGAPENSRLRAILSEMGDLPFLAIESDGSPMTQQAHAKLEAFCLRAQRLHQRMLKQKRSSATQGRCMDGIDYGQHC